MAPMRTFQDIILTLQRYWSERGCVLLQPYDMEVGAGTSHTATFLRALGPEPWKAAYVQPPAASCSALAFAAIFGRNSCAYQRRHALMS